MIKIRPFSEKDLCRLMEMIFSYYCEMAGHDEQPISEGKILRTVNTLAADPAKGKIFIIEVGRRLAGYAILIYHWSNESGGETLFIDELYVEPGSRRRGAATAFLAWVEENENFFALQVAVNPDNRAACGLFKKAGFSPRPEKRALFKPCNRVTAARKVPDLNGTAALPQLITERLLLKAIDESYASEVLDFFKRNRGFLQKWEPLRPADFYTLEYQKKEIISELLSMRRGAMYKFWLFKKEEDPGCSRVIGSAALSCIARGCFQSCFLGYRMDKAETNRGYMTEALRCVIDFAFNRLRLHRIEANIMPRSHASRRVVEKLGFHYEGLARQYLQINGRWADHMRFVLLK